MLVLLLGLSTVVLFPEIAHAADPSETSETVEQSIAKLLSIVMEFLNMLLWPFLIIIGDLMDTDLILGPGMEERLKGIWIPVRDLVNIAFAVVLLIVAFYNVLGLGGGEGDLALKTALPKIVLGLVLVNFTFIAGKVVLDLVNVATTAAFALPELASTDETPYDFGEVTEEFTVNVCYKSISEATSEPTYWNEDTDGDNVPIYTRLFCQKNETTADYDALDPNLQAKYFTNLNANNVGLVMAVNMGGLGSLSLLKEEGITSFSDLSISIMFAVVMYLVFAISYLVLGIVLLTRLIVLWIALALSPLAVLVYVVPQIKEWAGGGGDFASKIIKHLIAPIIIGVTMSMGYILISAWDGLTGGAALDGGGFKVDEVISTEFLISGIDDLPQFIIALASIVIVWTGVFAAASDTYASFATDAIKGFGERVRDAAFKAPTLLPTVPVGVKNGENQYTSLAALKGLADSGLRQIEYGSAAEKGMQELADKNPIAKALLGNNAGGGTRDPRTNALNIQDTLAKKDRDGKLLYSDASQIANYLYNTINEKSTASASDKAALLQEVRGLQTQYSQNTGSIEPLKRILERSASDLGIEEASVHRNIQERAEEVNGLTATPPTPAATPPPVAPTLATAVEQPVTLVAGLTTGAGTVSPARTAQLTAARQAIDTARPLVPANDTASAQTLNALDDLIEAESAVDAYLVARGTTPPPADLATLKTAAEQATTKARASATTAAHAPSTARATALRGQI